ncbi:DUF6349 family protein [Streptomyces sp. NPDC005279]|uniref:DUF6349 family protein n=1 Tax=Streptomyces sp. NPDC005279 TaxID=3364712 RepID=UPI0036820251
MGSFGSLNTSSGPLQSPAPATRQHPCPKAVARWIHRGGCLACPWEGPDRPRRDAAIEGAQDHTHPEWRTLPILDPARGGRGSKTYVTAAHPKGGSTSACPLRLYAHPPSTGTRPGGPRRRFHPRPSDAHPSAGHPRDPVPQQPRRCISR